MHVCVCIHVLIRWITEGYPFYFLYFMSLDKVRIVSVRNCGINFPVQTYCSKAISSAQGPYCPYRYVAAVPNTSFKQFSETRHKTQKQGRGSFCRASPSKPYVLYSPCSLPPLVAHTEGRVCFPVAIFSPNETLIRTVTSSHYF